MRSIRYRLFAAAVLVFALASPRAAAQVPANDSCAGAVVITGLPFNYSQNSRLATPDPADPILACADSGGGKTVWFVFTPDSTQYVAFSTAASTPADYDVALGLFTGSCGSLVVVRCADDISPGTVRQAILGYEVQAGVTYYLHVAEWNGGGTSGGVPTGGDLVLDVYPSSPLPIYAGPKSGSVAGGATIILSTMGAQNVPGGVSPEPEEAAENPGEILYPSPADVMRPLAPAGSNFHADPSLKSPHDRISEVAATAQPVVLKNFKGNTATGFIPPDPIVAVGPNHVIGMVNSAFTMWDKDGNLLESRSLNTWFGNVASPIGFSDPQVLYDHFAHRWIIAGGNFASPYTMLISVSDDDDPYGTWYNWSLPAGLGDSLTGNLPDYPQIGYDSLAIYVTTREFGSLFYSRVRIIEKTQLLNNDAGPVSWTDFWDLRDPDHPGNRLDGVRPSIIYGSPGVHYLVNAAPYNPGTFFTVWTIHDPIGTPTITAENVPAVEYLRPTQASQLGGGTTLESDGAIRHKAVYRDSSLWLVHSIASGAGDAYAAVHYVRLNPHTGTNLEDEAMGGDGFWHIYPAIMADANHNIAITYTRSGVSEYPGAFVTGHRDTDPPGLSPSVTLIEGVGNYDVTGGDGRNRWGDYMGIGLDPVDSLAFWVNTEYAVYSDVWETRVGMVKMGPLPGAYINSNLNSLSFGTHEVTDTTGALTFTLVNNGIDTLVIPSVDLPDSNFFLDDPPSFPIQLATFEVETLRVKFAPQVRGTFADSLVVNSNDSVRPALRLTLNGTGFIVDAAASGTMYSSSGTGDAGRLRTVDPVDASTSPVGPSGFNQLLNIRVRNSTGEIIGLAINSATTASSYKVVRVNASLGDAHEIASIPLTFVKGMTFRGDTMYVARITGQIYSVDLATGTPTLVASTGKQISAIDVNPVTGELWAAVKGGVGPVDGIYKVAMPSGTATLVGTTGFAVPTVDIAFDANGTLFALVGTAPASSELALIDTLSGGGTKIGPLGITTAQSIAFHPDVANFAFSYHFFQKWNLLSIPFEVPAPTPGGIFPQALLGSKAYTYDGGYIASDSLRRGVGYWIKMTAAQAHSIIGNPDSTDTVGLAPRWNMIAPSTFIAPVTGLSTDPPSILMTPIYAYDDTGYAMADSLIPGRGYWVRASAAGTLHLNVPTGMPPSSQKAPGRDALAGLSVLRVEDAAGRAQTLRFGRPGTPAPPAELFELPPLPPDGGFDARFGNGSMVGYNDAAAGAQGGLPLRILTDRYPVTLRWSVRDDAGASYALAWLAGGAAAAGSAPVAGEGGIALTEAQTRGLRLVMGSKEVPAEFSLSQNYPNPFNPSTVVEYALPRAVRVRLVLYNTLGAEVATVVDAEQDAGYHSAVVSGERLASGVYFYKLTAGSYTSSRKMLLLR